MAVTGMILGGIQLGIIAIAAIALLVHLSAQASRQNAVKTAGLSVANAEYRYRVEHGRFTSSLDALIPYGAQVHVVCTNDCKTIGVHYFFWPDRATDTNFCITTESDGVPAVSIGPARPPAPDGWLELFNNTSCWGHSTVVKTQ
jgi:hypothetical protein